MNSKTMIAIPVLALALALPAGADTTLRYQVSGGRDATPLVLKARPGEIRVEGAALGEQFKWMIYRSADDTLYAVDPQAQTYLALDSTAIDHIAQRLDALRADLRRQLERMPIGQRKEVESQIGDFLKQPEGESAAMEVRMGSDTAEVNDIVCRKGQVLAHGAPIGELCVASIDAVGLTRAEFDAYQGLYRLINRLQTAMSSDAVKTLDITTLSGVPISMSIESRGIGQTLRQVTHERLPDELFEIPEDYQRREPQDLLQ